MMLMRLRLRALAPRFTALADTCKPARLGNSSVCGRGEGDGIGDRVLKVLVREFFLLPSAAGALAIELMLLALTVLIVLSSLITLSVGELSCCGRLCLALNSGRGVSAKSRLCSRFPLSPSPSCFWEVVGAESPSALALLTCDREEDVVCCMSILDVTLTAEAELGTVCDKLCGPFLLCLRSLCVC